MEIEDFVISGKKLSYYGQLIIHSDKPDSDFFIPGEYEFRHKEVHDIQRLVKINGKIYTYLKIPYQEEIIAIIATSLEQIKDEDWFADSAQSQNQFTRFENIIAKAILSFGLDHNSKIGLIGELFLLDSILSSAPQTVKRDDIIQCWYGHATKSRDFIFGNHCIEVKSTTNEESIHHINNINQVDPRDDDGGITCLFLASVGLKLDDNGHTIPSLVASILTKVPSEERKKGFLESVRNYGIHIIGYNHVTMNQWKQFQDSYEIAFDRYYDMSDSNVKVIRFADIEQMSAVIDKTITYKIKLDTNIHGSPGNPKNLQELLTSIF